MTELIELANRLIWKKPELNILPEARAGEEYPLLARILQQQLKLLDRRGRLFLPDLRAYGNDSVAIFSDYSGESSGSYYTYAVLVCGYSFTGAFNQRMKAVRERHHLGELEIAFKDFGKGPIRRALPEYLEVLNALPGFLCTLAVDKSLKTLFGPNQKSTNDTISRMLEIEGLGKWKPKVAEKLLRIVHLAAFLTALLAHDGQKVFWMSDNDAICPNNRLHDRLLSIFDRVLTMYTQPNCKFPLIGGAVPFEPRCVELMDLLSVPDVVAGSVQPCIPKSGSVPEVDARVKGGADDVLRWLANDGIGLKKAIFMIRPAKGGMIEGGTIQLEVAGPRKDMTVIPVFA